MYLLRGTCASHHQSYYVLNANQLSIYMYGDGPALDHCFSQIPFGLSIFYYFHKHHKSRFIGDSQ